MSCAGPRTYLCAGMTGGGVLATCVVRVVGTALYIDNTYTGYAWIDLSNVSFRYAGP